MSKPYLNRDASNAIKGIALICMFVHHLYAFPDRIIESVIHPDLTVFSYLFCAPTRICVPVFAFLTGYFYSFTKQQTLSYSLRKATDLLVAYWIVYIPMLLFAVLSGCYPFQITDFIFELFALKSPVMTHNWYVRFYCTAIFILPLYSYVSRKFAGKFAIMHIIATVFLFTFINRSSANWVIQQLSGELAYWFPCMISGFIFAEKGYFEQIQNLLDRKITSISIRILLSFCMICTSFMGRFLSPEISLFSNNVWHPFTLWFSMDIFYAPMFIFGVNDIYGLIHNRIPGSILCKIGNRSLLMWFIHCIFSNVCKEITQPIFYAPYNPVLVVSFCLLFSYAVAVLLDPILRRLLHRKKEYLAHFSGFNKAASQ